MAKSLRDLEGYYMTDHRAAIPVPEDILRQSGLPTSAGKGLFEAATFTCKHCQRVVVMNPNRTREREYCRGCNHYICDNCAAVKAVTKQCKTFDQVLDEALIAATVQQSTGG
jgi:hypothetical protein